MAEILALGDCNMSGDVNFKHNAYAERFARRIEKSVMNVGYTMATTREMQHFFQNYYTKECDIVLLQYGLVDSWKTFKYAPYVMYYPDNLLRKIGRKVVKKYKKITRQVGLNTLLGTQNVVGKTEYQTNIENLILSATNSIIILIDTIPNQQQFRNNEIVQYNSILSLLSERYNNCYKLDLYQDFLKNMDSYYLDETHMNDLGYNHVTDKLVSLYEKIKKEKV